MLDQDLDQLGASSALQDKNLDHPWETGGETILSMSRGTSRQVGVGYGLGGGCSAQVNSTVEIRRWPW